MGSQVAASTDQQHEAQQSNSFLPQVPQILAALRQDLVQPACSQKEQEDCPRQEGSFCCSAPDRWVCASCGAPSHCQVQLQGPRWPWLLPCGDQGCGLGQAGGTVPWHCSRPPSPQPFCEWQAGQRAAPARVQGQPWS